MDKVSPIIWFTSSSLLDELEHGIKTVISKGCKSLLLLTCIDNQYDELQTNTILEKCSLPIGGGMFPQIIFNENTYSYGAIVLGFAFEPIITNYTQLSTCHSDLSSYICEQSKDISDYQNFIIIADALCNANEDFIEQFYDYIGSGITVVGGGVGSLDFIPRAAIYSNQGVLSDAVQIIAIPCLLEKEVGHGWEVLDGPYLVTASQGHYVHSLNYIPAFELYRDVLNRVTDIPLKQNSFFDTAKHFPLGIDIADGELVIRDPIKSNGEYLECVGNVPVYSTVYLLKGERDKILMSSAKISLDLTDRGKSNVRLLFNCISRGLYLGKGIKDELKAIQQNSLGSNVVGAMSIGEITDFQGSAIRILNKSTVIVSFANNLTRQKG